MFSTMTRQHPDHMTFPAMALAAINPGVFVCVLVSALAMSLGALHFSGLVRSDKTAESRFYSASQILATGNGFQVPGIHAAPDTAKVVKVETFGDRSYEEFVANAVGLPRPPILVRSYSVTANREATEQPAPTERFRGNLAHEPVEQRTVPPNVFPAESNASGNRRQFINRDVGLRCQNAANKCAPAIFDQRHRLKVGGVDASSDAADVIDDATLRDRAYMQLPGDVVSEANLLPVLIPQRSVAVISNGPGPEPAAGVGQDNQFFGEPVEKRTLIIARSHVTPFQSHWSGSRSIASAVVTRFYFTALEAS
jgi:hypothetical protein